MKIAITGIGAISAIGSNCAEMLEALQDAGDFTKLMYSQERVKTLPFGDIWEEYLKREGMQEDYYAEVLDYEKKVLMGRK